LPRATRRRPTSTSTRSTKSRSPRAGSDASQQGAGVQINFVTKSGGNKLRGSGRFFDTNERFEANNITDAQRDLGATGGNPIQDIKDYGIEIGGPIKKNKAWFWGAMSNNTIHVGVVNFFDTSTPSCATVATTPTPGQRLLPVRGQGSVGVLQDDETVLINYNGKLQFQENAANKSTFTVTDGIKTRNARGADAFHPLITTRRQDGPTIFYRGEHQWIISNRLTMTAQYLHISENWGQRFQNDTLKDVQAIQFIDTGFFDRNTASGNYDTHRPQDDIRADANYFLSNFLGGDHSMKFGFAYRRSPVESLTTFGGGANTRVRSAAFKANCNVGGVTALCDEADIKRDSDFSYILYGRSLYWNDSYKKNRATINVGLRYDRQFDIVRSATTPANVILPDLLPGLQYPGADSGARYNNLSPRGGLTYDLRGDGKSVLKVNAGRYYGLGMYTASTLQPTNATTLRYAWRDLNGDQSVQRNELDIAKGFLTTPTSNYDPANPSAAVTPATVDPNLRNDKTDELILGFDHELMPNFGVGVSYIYRKYSDLLGTYRTLDFTEAYVAGVVQRGVRQPGDLRHAVVFGHVLSAPDRAARPDHPPQRHQVQHLQRRRVHRAQALANKWMMNGSLVYNNQKHFEPNANTDYLDPTNHAPIDLISGYESGGITLEQLGGRNRHDQHVRPQCAGHRQAVGDVSIPVGESTSRRTSTVTRASRTTRTS
jgi:hypothetical protein